MALTPCAECGKPISKKAATCPGCGAKVEKRHSKLQWAFIGLCTVGIVSCIAQQQSAEQEKAAALASVEAAKTPEQRAAEAKQAAATEAQFQRIVRGAKTLKQSSKNPDSFKLTSAILLASGTVCYSYSGTNSFNAVVPGYAAMVKDTLQTSETAWQTHCNGKTGESFGHARYAL